MKEVKAAYLAGIVDGEGHISLVKRTSYYVPVVNISNTNEALISKVKEILDYFEIQYCVSFSDRKERNNAKPAWTVCVQGKKRVAKLLPIILPFLTAKTNQALLVLDWCADKRERRRTLNEDDFSKISNIRELNKRGVRVR